MAVEFPFGLDVSAMQEWTSLSPDEQALYAIATIDGDNLFEASDIDKAAMLPSQLASDSNQSRYAWGRDILLNGLTQRLAFYAPTHGQLYRDVILATATHLAPEQILQVENQLNEMYGMKFTDSYTPADWQATAMALTVLANASALEDLMIQQGKTFGFDVINFAKQATTAITSGMLQITQVPTPADQPFIYAQFIPDKNAGWGQIKCHGGDVPADLLFHELYHTWQFLMDPQTENNGQMTYEPQAYMAGGFYRVASGMDDSSLSGTHQFDVKFSEPKEKFIEELKTSLEQTKKYYGDHQQDKEGPLYAVTYVSIYLKLQMAKTVPEYGKNLITLAAEAAQIYFTNPNNKPAIEQAQKRVVKAFFANVGPFNQQLSLCTQLFTGIKMTAFRGLIPLDQFLSNTVASMEAAPPAPEETPFKKAEAQFKLHYFKAMQLAAEGKIEDAKQYIDEVMIPSWLSSAMVN